MCDDQPELEPNYRRVDAENCPRQFVNFSYDRSILIADGVRLTFIDADHIEVARLMQTVEL